MGTPELKTAWYFAEGSTGPGFGETLTVLNPNPAATQTAVTYYPAGGQPKTVTHTVPPMSRQVIPVNELSEAGSWQAVGMRVTADLPILAERAMTFGYGAVVGAHNVVGTSAPARSLNLAEGHVGGGFDEYLALLNANEVTTTATIRYVIPGGTTQTASLELPAGSRTTVHLNDVIAGTVDCAIHIDADLPITAERVSYFRLPSTGWIGGHATAALPDSALSRDVIFAGHAAGPRSLDYFSLFNPGPYAATVTLVYLAAAGPVHKTVTVAGFSRVTELATQAAPGLQGGAEITSTVPILIERASYFAY